MIYGMCGMGNNAIVLKRMERKCDFCKRIGEKCDFFKGIGEKNDFSNRNSKEM